MTFKEYKIKFMIDRFFSLYEKERQPFTPEITAELDKLQAAIKSEKLADNSN